MYNPRMKLAIHYSEQSIEQRWDGEDRNVEVLTHIIHHLKYLEQMYQVSVWDDMAARTHLRWKQPESVASCELETEDLSLKQSRLPTSLGYQRA